METTPQPATGEDCARLGYHSFRHGATDHSYEECPLAALRGAST